MPRARQPPENLTRHFGLPLDMPLPASVTLKHVGTIRRQVVRQQVDAPHGIDATEDQERHPDHVDENRLPRTARGRLALEEVAPQAR
jgi:hypothetical protein